MPKSIRAVLSAILGKDSELNSKDQKKKGEKLLRFMAESRNIDVTDKKTDTIFEELCYYIESLGLSVFLKLLTIKLLKGILDKRFKVDKKPEKNRPNKATIVKQVHDDLEENGPRAHLEECDKKVLDEVLEYLEIDKPDSKRDCVKLILTTANEMGLEHFLSGFPITKLKEFIKACNLKVETDSMDTLLQCLMEQESIKAPFKTDEIPSKHKPIIDKNISVVDLHHHYFRDELAEWCSDKRVGENEKLWLNPNGSKREIVSRIRRYFEDKLETKDYHKEKPKEKATEEKSSSSEESSSIKEKKRRHKSSSKREKDNKSSDSDYKEKEKKKRKSSTKREKPSNSSESREEKKKSKSNSVLIYPISNSS